MSRLLRTSGDAFSLMLSEALVSASTQCETISTSSPVSDACTVHGSELTLDEEVQKAALYLAQLQVLKDVSCNDMAPCKGLLASESLHRLKLHPVTQRLCGGAAHTELRPRHTYLVALQAG